MADVRIDAICIFGGLHLRGVLIAPFTPGVWRRLRELPHPGRPR